MSLPTSPMAYETEYQTMDLALADPAGIRVRMDRDAATNFRMRCHQARKIDRDQNTLTYPRGHHLHGASQYDKLTLRIREDGEATWLYFEKSELPTGSIESLSGTELPADPPSSRGSEGPAPEGLGPPKITDRSLLNEDLGDAFDKVEPTTDIRRV